MAENYPTFTPEELQSESWLPVPGYEGIYSASSLGRIRIDRETIRKGRLLSVFVNRYGYLNCTLSKDSKNRAFNVHRIIALTFLGVCPPKLAVNHINGDKKDNRVINLEYVSYKENTAHARKLGLLPVGDRSGARKYPERRPRGEQSTKAKLTEDDVRQIKKMLAEGWQRAYIARRFGVTPPTIGAIKDGTSWKHIP